MYFARRILLVLFGFGIFAGFGSGIASARWHARHGGGCDGRWNNDRFSERWNRNDEPNAVVAPAPVTTPVQNVVVPSAPAPAAPAPQVFVITVPSGAAAPAAAPQIITVPVPMPAAAPAPAAKAE
ncbi:MAG: hypothetical protein QM817_00855 [Archangium sp.]